MLRLVPKERAFPIGVKKVSSIFIQAMALPKCPSASCKAVISQWVCFAATPQKGFDFVVRALEIPVSKQWQEKEYFGMDERAEKSQAAADVIVIQIVFPRRDHSGDTLMGKTFLDQFQLLSGTAEYGDVP